MGKNQGHVSGDEANVEGDKVSEGRTAHGEKERDVPIAVDALVGGPTI